MPSWSSFRPTNVLIPSAGLGTRFSGHFNDVYKPFITIKNLLIIEHAIQGALQSYNVNRILVAIRKEIFDEYQPVIRGLKESYPLQVICLESVTSGAAETVSLTIPFLTAANRLDQLAVVDCDTAAHIPVFHREADIVVPHAFSSSNGYSYLKCLGDQITDIVEKRVISQKAVVGHYLFSSSTVFEAAYGKLLQLPPSSSELYMSSLISQNLDDFRVETVQATSWSPLGTPSEVSQFLNLERQ